MNHDTPRDAALGLALGREGSLAAARLFEQTIDGGDGGAGREQLTLITDTLPALISYIDRDLRYRFVNSEYERWFGLPREKLLGRTVFEVLGELATVTLREKHAAVLGGASITFELEVEAPRGGKRNVRSSYVPHRDRAGEVVGFVALIQDVTEQQRIEREREALVERLRVLARASDVLAGSLEDALTLEHVLELALPLLGDFGFFDVVQEDGSVRRVARAHDDARRQALLDRTGWVRLDENLCALSSGQPALHPHIDDAWLEDAAFSPEHLTLMRALDFGSMLTVPLLYRGRALGALTLFCVAKGRSHTQADLTLAEELARRAAASIENARLFKQAQDAINVRDDFLSVAGHELRTPLTALQLQVLSIEKLLKEAGSTDKLIARSEKAARNVLRLSSLVNELLDISRISAGRLTLELSSFALPDAVKDVLSRLSEELSRAGCLVELTVHGELRGTWDRTRVEQIVTNLVSNALKYGKGKPLEITLERVDSVARLSVRDLGIGISREDQARIFERFERAVSSRHFGGLGLGLWITRQLVDAHGGTITVESAPERGATFTVDLPI